MDKNLLESFKTALETTIKDKSLTDSIITRMVNSEFQQRRGVRALDTALGGEAEAVLTRVREIFKTLEDPAGRERKLLDETFAENIAIYLATISNYSLDYITEELNRIKVSSYLELYRQSFTSLVAKMYIQIFSDWANSGLFKPNNNQSDIEFFKGKITVATYLFYSLVDISFERLGVENTLKLVSEFLRGFYEKSFERNTGTYVETFIDAVEYCKQNSEYPIEWLISVAFDQKSCDAKIVL